MTTRSRRTPHENKVPRGSERHSPRTSLVLAELSYQRGDVPKALQLLKRLRLNNAKPGFKEENLYGCSLGLGLHFDQAIKVFDRLSRTYKSSGLFYEKVRFNCGLVHLFHDLNVVGDLTITRQMISGSNLLATYGIPSHRLEQAFAPSIRIWNELIPSAKYYQNIVLTYLGFASLLQGDLQQALDHIKASLQRSKNFSITYYVLGRIFLDFYFLTEDDIHFSLKTDDMAFFGLNPSEGELQKDGRYQLNYDALLRIAFEAFWESFQQNPQAPEVCLALVICSFLMGAQEELLKYLNIAESMIPESKALLDLVYWLVRESLATPADVNAILKRLYQTDMSPSKDVFHIISPYFLI